MSYGCRTALELSSRCDAIIEAITETISGALQSLVGTFYATRLAHVADNTALVALIASFPSAHYEWK